MRVLFIGLAALLLTATGCVRVYRVDPTSGPSSFRDLNGATEHHRSWIELTDGRIRTGDRMHASGDTVSWYGVDSATRRYAVPTTQVHKIRVKKHGRGMGHGALWGLAVGGILGSAVGASTMSDKEWGWEGGAVILGGFSAGVGAGAGALLGLILGDRDEYVFQRSAERVPDGSPSHPDVGGTERSH
jgi:hypothetical protein